MTQLLAGVAVRLALGLSISWLGQATAADTLSRDLAVVTSANTPVSALTMSEVRELFRGDRQYWSRDLPVVLLLPPSGSPEFEVVLRSVFQMTDSQYRRYWIARIFRAEVAAPPKTVQGTGVANELVASIPGAITLIQARMVKPGLKILPVDGSRPGEPGYPIR